ncbi:hypothetical protein [Nocardia brasiliensis]|uniref:hypothetical protein n=1 Tax=Nocardia brasiliensis TaxID=37326 RepID=UPI0004A75573|nr:hypothetical protein [Nocardia brasiliensis]
MSLPARRDDEDAQKLALAPDDGPGGYLQRSDGSWLVVDAEGWAVDPNEFRALERELHADALSAIAAVTYIPIDVDPISVRDTEIR